MGVPATPADPRATFNYSLEVEGLQIALVTTAQIPDVELGDIEHNGAGSVHSTHTGGRLKFGEWVLEKAMPAGASDKWGWKWLTTVRDPETGIGLPASQYKKNGSLLHLGQASEVIDRWDFRGAFVRKLVYSKNDSGQDNERLIETVTLRIDWYKRV